MVYLIIQKRNKGVCMFDKKEFDAINKEDLIESIYKGGAYGMVVSKYEYWLDEEEMRESLDYEVDVDELANYSLDFKDDKYLVYEYVIVCNNKLSTHTHFNLQQDFAI